MRPDVIDELRAADPARSAAAQAGEPDWDTMARSILATPRAAQPRRRGRRRLAFVLAPVAAAAALVAVAVAALLPAEQPLSPLERAYAAVSESAIYHYAMVTQELEGPQRRPLADTRSRAEGWIDPGTGEVHEIGDGMEWATDGRQRIIYIPFADMLQEIPEPGEAGPDQAGTEVLGALTRSYRAGALRDAGPAVYEGRPVRRLVAVNPTRTWRQTFLVDAETYLPVLFVTETGDHIREGTTIPGDQRVIEQRFERFERLPDGADRSLLRMRPHPGANRGGPTPAPAAPSSGRRP